MLQVFQFYSYIKDQCTASEPLLRKRTVTKFASFPYKNFIIIIIFVAGSPNLSSERIQPEVFFENSKMAKCNQRFVKYLE